MFFFSFVFPYLLDKHQMQIVHCESFTLHWALQAIAVRKIPHIMLYSIVTYSVTKRQIPLEDTLMFSNDS